MTTGSVPGGDDKRSMPPRPGMSDLTPAPIRGRPKPTPAISAMRGLWLASFALGVAAILYSFVFRDAQVEQLRAVLLDQQPGLTDDQAKTTATAAFLVSLSALGLLVIVQAILLRAVMAGHGAVRWAQLGAVLVQAVVALAATAFVALGDTGVLAIAFVLTELLSACAALIAGVLPASQAWFRGERQRRRER